MRRIGPSGLVVIVASVSASCRDLERPGRAVEVLNPAAAAALRACLRITPDDVPLLLALTTLQIKDSSLATAGETVRLAEHARRVNRRVDPATLATLSRAYLGAGRREDARTTGQQAAAVALRDGPPEAAAEINGYVAGLRGMTTPPAEPVPGPKSRVAASYGIPRR